MERWRSEEKVSKLARGFLVELVPLRQVGPRGQPAKVLDGVRSTATQWDDVIGVHFAAEEHLDVGLLCEPVGDLLGAADGGGALACEIGRASCRERV